MILIGIGITINLVIRSIIWRIIGIGIIMGVLILPKRKRTFTKMR